MNFDFFGLDLSQIPMDNLKEFMAGKAGFAALIIFIIPIISTITTYLSSKVTTYMNNSKKDEKEEAKKPERVLSPDQKPQAGSGNAEAMTKTMSWMMPLMTLWLTVTLPSTLGLYWTISNVLSLAQTILLNGYYNKKLTAEIEAQDAEREKKLLEKQKKYNITKKKKRG